MDFTENELARTREKIKEDRMELLTDLVNISQVPAPTGKEGNRAEVVADRFREVGVDNVYIDTEGNVVAYKKTRDVPAVCVTAHLDTVFDESVDHTVQIDDRQVQGPGVGDDSLGLATLLSLGRILPDREPGNLLFVATTATEGHGNLRGSRYFVENCREKIELAMSLEGHGLGRVDHWSLGALRLHISAESQGGHVWRDDTGENPIEIMSEIIASLKKIKDQAREEENFGIINAGVIRGGSAFNTVPYDCGLDLEIRSDDADTLEKLSKRVFAVVHEIDSSTPVNLKIKEVSRRPVSGIDSQHWLVKEIEAVHKKIDISSSLGPASSDGCIFLDRGIPTVTLGLARGHYRHREDEMLEMDSIEAGQLQTVLAVLAASRRLMQIKEDQDSK